MSQGTYTDWCSSRPIALVLFWCIVLHFAFWLPLVCPSLASGSFHLPLELPSCLIHPWQGWMCGFEYFRCSLGRPSCSNVRPTDEPFLVFRFPSLLPRACLNLFWNLFMIRWQRERAWRGWNRAHFFSTTWPNIFHLAFGSFPSACLTSFFFYFLYHTLTLDLYSFYYSMQETRSTWGASRSSLQPAFQAWVWYGGGTTFWGQLH